MIKVKDLVFTYSGAKRNALDGINLEIPKGKYVALLGHNGSGKSTFGKLLVGLYKAASGSIVIDGVEVRSSTKDIIHSKIGIVFQNPDNQFIGGTVEDDIAFGLENKQMKPKEISETINTLSKQVGMYEYLQREPISLSGGQKQRVAIASVLALNPEVIIFDEVTSMLDPKGKQSVLKLIREIQKQREKTLISITHDMDEAIQADHLIVFSDGKLVAQGSPKEILNNKEIIELAKIDSPFIYKLSEHINGIQPTYNEEELLEELWKLL
ncbi:energy-coupling factor transport system ATP-binding protein [Mycoplasma testudineum]|uniref:Energy-coupling factor transport system ATP-binding protein n=1 Tax=Mycoplasma testudineum TaxID=244584 RepID=A0A4R6IGY1_9MOLU|nr:energy-coupling factor transporter ATPase [Mycoplasma testudineum]OYD27111.1 energy-coupling factor transporter ATPase [Mycoplasma testudineum]TDO21136.1 energy-coupling factor transport system ATP-binding protein [Mycoplasma testudineum]